MGQDMGKSKDNAVPLPRAAMTIKPTSPVVHTMRRLRIMIHLVVRHKKRIICCPTVKRRLLAAYPGAVLTWFCREGGGEKRYKS